MISAFRLALLLPLATAALAQDGDATRALETRARYLARRPYHVRVFDEFVEIAREADVLEAWLARFAGEAATGDEAAVILLARLEASAGETEAALLRLDELESEDPACAALRARMLVAAGREDEASGNYARATAGMERGEERAVLLREQADLLVRLGRIDEARDAYAALAGERPEDLLLRLDVAEACARGGLVDDALGHYRVALEVAAGDPEAESRAYFALGRLAEARNLVDEAESSYRAALDRLGRGHWLREGVFARLLAHQRRRGTLEAWREELTARLDGGLSDPLPFEDLAQVAGAMGEPDAAADLLARAAEWFPADTRLARRRVALARDLGRVDEWIDLLQARVAQEGESVEARLELADAFLDADRADAARLQWERIAELGAQRPETLADLARRRAEAGEDEPVVALLRRVVELAPGDVRGWADLARHHRARGREDAAGAELERAEAALGMSAAARGEQAELWLEFDRPERALAVLAPLRDASPDDLRITRRVADVLVLLARGDEARSLLRPLILAAEDGSRLRTLVGAWLDSFATASERTVALATRTEAALAEGGDRADFWIAALGNARIGDPARAARLFASRMEDGGPDAHLALEERAELALDAGELDVALPLLDRLAELDPQGLFALEVEAITRLLSARRPDDARGRLARLDPGDSVARLRDLASLHRRLNQTGEAIALLERAARLAADDPRPWRELAELCRAEFRFPEALANYQVAYRLAHGRPRVETAIDLERFLDEHGRAETEVRRLARLGQERPLEAWASLLAVDLLVAHDRPFEARDLLDGRIEALPFEPLFIAKRAELSARLGFAPERRADLESLRAMGVGGDVDLRLLEARLTEDPTAWVGDLLSVPEAPLDVAECLIEFGRYAEARDVLERARGRDPSVDLDLRLAEAYFGLGHLRDYAAALERVVAAVEGPAREILERLGRVQAGLGRRERALEIGRLLLARFRPRSVAPYYAEIGEGQALPAEACRAARLGLEDNPSGLATVSEDLLVMPGGREALAQLLDELLVEALEAGRAPTGRSPAHFALELVERRAQLDPVAETFDPARPISWLRAAFLGIDPPKPSDWRAARDDWNGEPASGAALVELGLRAPSLRAEAARLALDLAGRLEELPYRALLELEAAQRRPQVDADVRALRIPAGDVDARARCAAWIDGSLRVLGEAAWLEPLMLRVEAAEAAHRAGAEDVVDAALDGLSAAAERVPFALLPFAESQIRSGRGAAGTIERLRSSLDALPVDSRGVAPFVSDAWIRIARAYGEAGREGEGYESLRLAGQPRHARRLVEDQGDRDAARLQLERRLDDLLETRPRLSDPKTRSAALDLVVFASELRWREDPDGALALVVRALETIGAEPRLFALHGRLLELAGRQDDALEPWCRAVDTASLFPDETDLEPELEVDGDPHRGAWKILAGLSDAPLARRRLHLLRLALTLGEPDVADEQLLPLLGAEPARGEAWVRNLVRATTPILPKAERTRWFGALHAAAPLDPTLFRTYVESLCADERIEDAAAVIASFMEGRELVETEQALVDYLETKVGR